MTERTGKLKVATKVWEVSISDAPPKPLEMGGSESMAVVYISGDKPAPILGIGTEVTLDGERVTLEDIVADGETWSAKVTL